MAEEPKYTILHRQEGYEIRDYDPAVIAEVVVEGPYRYAMNWGSICWPITSSATTADAIRSR